MKLVEELTEGMASRRFYRTAWRSYDRDVRVTMPIPICYIVGWSRWLWLEITWNWLKTPEGRAKHIRKAFQDGLVGGRYEGGAVGYKRARDIVEDYSKLLIAKPWPDEVDIPNSFPEALGTIFGQLLGTLDRLGPA